MAEFHWFHIRERLPPLGVKVLVSKHGSPGELPCVAWRRDCGAGGWEWDNHRDDCEQYLCKLEYWTHIAPLPERLNVIEARRLGPPVDEQESAPFGEGLA